MRDDSSDEHLDGLLEALVEAEKREGKKIEADVVTWRGMMTKACFSAIHVRKTTRRTDW